MVEVNVRYVVKFRSERTNRYGNIAIWEVLNINGW